jgi:hypothetical protein
VTVHIVLNLALTASPCSAFDNAVGQIRWKV